MKCMNKTVSLLLVLVMMLGLSVTAFAAEVTPPTPAPANTITVTKARAGEIYKAYKMMDLTVDADKINYAYTVNSAWANFFAAGQPGSEYINIDAVGYVTWKEDKKTEADMITFGKLAAAYAEKAESPLTPVDTKDLSAATENQSIVFEVDPGYYLITSTNGTKVIVDTTPAKINPTIAEKNADPTIRKRVEESAGIYYQVNDAQIGQAVNFRTVVLAKSGARNYVVHDTMSKGLTFDPKSVTITVGETTLRAKPAEGETAEGQNDYDYEVITDSRITDGCTFEIVFKKAYLDTITADINIVITYSTTLNAEAEVGIIGNTNKTKLTWGNNSSTTEDQTITYTWEAGVFKYGNGEDANPLADAKFVLLNSAKDKVAKFDAEGKITEWVALPAAGEDNKITLEEWDPASIQTTGTDGMIVLQGLDGNVTYYLREVKAPAGYNLLNGDQTLAIEARIVDPTTANAMTQKELTVKVNNQSGTELPETGGIGTTIFYVIGSILLVGAAVLLIVKRRMRAEQ